jgi:hypothetical protein
MGAGVSHSVAFAVARHPSEPHVLSALYFTPPRLCLSAEAAAKGLGHEHEVSISYSRLVIAQSNGKCHSLRV